MISAESPRVFAEAARLKHWLIEGGRLWLFLDYDGTLTGFAPSPDVIIPDQPLIELLTSLLVPFPQALRIVILSGRRLEDIARLLPIPGILIAGTYGIEFRDFEGQLVHLVDLEAERPVIDRLKRLWKELSLAAPPLHLEDKGYALALHARDLPDEKAADIIATAIRQAEPVISGTLFRIIGGHKFVEVAPKIADKGQSVKTLLKRFPWPEARLVYIGDDDKDEAGFAVVKDLGGYAIVVSENHRPTEANARLKNPVEVRRWLKALVALD